MSTKGLMADKRVESVEVNDKGKAIRLTLVEGLLWEGSRGPFDLTNVEHGHKIVKGAVGDGSGVKIARKPKSGPSNAPSGPSLKPIAPAPLKPKGDELFVYRLQIMPKGDERKQVKNGLEVCGWLKITYPLKPKELEERTWSMLKPHLKDAKPETHECRSFRWKNKHQAEARKNQEMGSPWHGENHGS